MTQSETGGEDPLESLRTRLDEDERIAGEASRGGWLYSDVESVGGGSLYDRTRLIASVCYEQPGDHDGRIVRHLLVREADANGRHFARHDPDRVRRLVAAHRTILGRYEQALARREARRREHGGSSDALEAEVAAWETTVRLLAGAYTEHSGQGVESDAA